MAERHVASVSFGKDSTAMVLLLIENQWPLDEVIFFNTGMEFDAIYRTRDRVVEILKGYGVKFTELKPKKKFLHTMLHHEYTTRTGEKRRGYGWCGGVCRWGTTEKASALDKHAQGARRYIGIALDEKKRLARMPEWQIAPLVSFGMTERDCLEFCYKRGFDFEGLYKHLDRVSCWCCRNKNMKELGAYYEHFPEYFDKLVALEEQIGKPMKPPYTLPVRFSTNQLRLAF